MNSKSSYTFELQREGKKIIAKPLHSASIAKPTSVRAQINVNHINNKFTLQNEPCREFDVFFESFVSNIRSMNIPEKSMDTFFCVCEDLVQNCQNLYKKLTPKEHEIEMCNVISTGTDYVTDKLKSRNTSTKRHNYTKNRLSYVKSTETAIGLTWKSQVNCGQEIVNHTLTQTTYQYVSLIDTLKSLFLNADFKKMYFDFNESKKHVCRDGVYEDFCCGSIYKENSHFNPTTLQIQLGIDDFEPCNALKSKSGLHKMCGVYMEVRNIHPELKSKICNIHLVAIANVQNLKGGDASFDIIAKRIVAELKLLETTGIRIDSGENLKGALINISADNLGANSVLGFNAHYYCRMCECHKTDCQTLAHEMSTKFRQDNDYASLAALPCDNENVDYQASKGIKKYCVFNDLHNYSIFQNCTMDIMHDCNEGIIPFFIKTLFTFIMDKHILDLPDIQRVVRDFNYGYIWKKYKPSLIKMTKRNLGQNAMQSYCLIIHLPFIFINSMEKLADIWCAMESLLQALQIIYSSCIRDSDIIRLQNCLQRHLSYLTDDVGVKLTPKHHFTTHYPNLIKKIGPLIHTWMMRFESKHKVFTDIAKRTNNFKNLAKTLANRNQEHTHAIRNHAFKIDVQKSKSTYDIVKCAKFDQYKFILATLLTDGRLLALKFLNCGPFQYRAGLMLIDKKRIFEIIHVVQQNEQNLLVCQKYQLLQFNYILNSIEIEEYDTPEYKLLYIDRLENKKTFDKIFHKNKSYIIADTLEVYNEFQT